MIGALTGMALSLTLAGVPDTDAPEPAPASRRDRPWGDLRVAPTLGVGVGQTREQLRLELDDGSARSETRALLHTRLDLGVSYAVWRQARLRARGQSSVGVGLVYGPGDWPVHLRQDFTVELVPRRWFGAFIGLGAGFEVNPNRPAYSTFAVGLPLGLRFGPVELSYRPSLAVALASETHAVLGGTQRQGPRTGLAPFEVVLRLRIPARRRV